MTEASNSVASILTPAEKPVWEAAESGRSKPVDGAGNDEASYRLRLFSILSRNNAGEASGAHQAAEDLGKAPSPLLDAWRRAEWEFSGHKLAMNFKSSLASKAAELLEAGGALDKLVAARILLALGAGAIRQKQGPEADALLARAAALLADIGSPGGCALVDLELGRLRLWQGNMDEATLCLLSTLNFFSSTGNVRATGVWHEIASLLLGARHVRQAIPILEALIAPDPDLPNVRARNALVGAFIADGQLEKAKAHAELIVKNEEKELAAKADHSPYRMIVTLRDIGEIELRWAFAASKAAAEKSRAEGRSEDESSAAGDAAAEPFLRNAEKALDQAAGFLGVTRSDQNPVFPAWTKQIDAGKEHSPSGAEIEPQNEFEKLRLAQLEALIGSYPRSGWAAAGRNLSKIADGFARRADVFQELEAREQAADALRRADDLPGARRQLGLAHRLAKAIGQTNIARKLRDKLNEVTVGTGKTLAGVVPIREISSNRLRKVIAGMDIEHGHRVLIHSYTIPGGEKDATDKATRALESLQEVAKQRRVLPGLPEIRALLRDEEGAKGALAFDLILEDVVGQDLAQVMASQEKDAVEARVKNAAGVVRSLAFTIQGLHNLGIDDCRPDVGRVILDIGNAPIWTEVLPLYEGKCMTSKDDVRMLANMMVQWLGGGPGERGRKMKPGDAGFLKSSVFPGAVRPGIPADLERLLTAILLDQGGTPDRPIGLADELEKYS